MVIKNGMSSTARAVLNTAIGMLSGSKTAGGGKGAKRGTGGKTKFGKSKKMSKLRGKAKGFGSFSMTKTKRKKKPKSTNTIWDMTKERWVHVFRKPSYVKSLGSATLYDTFQAIHTGTQGVQNCFILKTIMSRAQLAGGTSTNRNDLFTFASNIWDMNPNRVITGSAIIPGQTPREDQIVWRTTDLKLSATSLESLTQEVTILWVSPKVANGETPVNSFDFAIDTTSMGIADAANPTLIGSTTTVGSGFAGTYGYDPRSIPHWRKLWKVIKVHKFLLPPGETHDIHCELKFNKKISKSWTEQLKSTVDDVVGLTIYPFVIVRGIPAPIKLVTDEAMVFSKTKVGFIMRSKHFFTYCDGTRYNYQRVNYGIPINTGITEQFIDDSEATNVLLTVPI